MLFVIIVSVFGYQAMLSVFLGGERTENSWVSFEPEANEFAPTNVDSATSCLFQAFSASVILQHCCVDTGDGNVKLYEEGYCMPTLACVHSIFKSVCERLMSV